jgi:hypothetical protein
MNPVPAIASGLIILALCAAVAALVYLWPDWIGQIPH